MNQTVLKIYSKFDALNSMVISMGVSSSESEDFVQDFILNLNERSEDLINECWDEESGKLRHYLWFVLRSYVYDTLRKRNAVKTLKTVPVADFFEKHSEYAQSDTDFERANDILLRKVTALLNGIDGYTSKVVRVKFATGMSYREMEREIDISYMSLWNTVKVAQDRVKELLGEDYEDLKNGDYSKIKFTPEDELLFKKGLQGSDTALGSTGDND